MKFILDKIVAHKKQELIDLKSTVSLDDLKASTYYKEVNISMESALSNKANSGIIAEFKRKSPSKGWIHKDANVAEIVSSYSKAGVTAISCLTDNYFFGGSKEDFSAARTVFDGPILRKDFIIDPFQIHESKAMGANVILLIAAILSKEDIISFTDLAHEIGLEVLLELHSNEELVKVYDKVNMIGVNNRDLRDFSVSLLQSIQMKKHLPKDKVLISESGLDHPGIVYDLYIYGFKGFLIGEYFMKQNKPGETASAFIKNLKERKKLSV